MSKLSSEFLPGDGEDPRYDKKDKKVDNRKALQLCAQVSDILNLTFAQMSEDVLRELYVSSVVPCPNTAQLLVTVVSDRSAVEVLPRLENAKGYLRTEVANGITRKKTPKLKFIM